MRRLNVLLIALLTLSALGLVTSQYHARRLFTAIDDAESREARIKARWDHLLVEQTELAKASLIVKKARSKLNLTERQPHRTMYLLMDAETRNQASDATLRWKSVRLGQEGR
ncbi:MAG: cell division protein FtsL [Burkholderiaceae bacterium]